MIFYISSYIFTNIMVLNKFRYIADRIVSSQVKLLVRWGVHPNFLSIMGVILGIFAAVTFALPEFFINSHIWSWLPPLLFFISGYLDLIDGGVARLSGKSSEFGGFLDSTLDRIADATAIIGLMIGNMLWNPLWFGGVQLNNILGYIAMTITILISYTRSRAENSGVIMKGVGLMERGERFFALLGGFIIEAILRAFVLEYNFFFFSIFFCIYLALCIYTVIARVVHSYKWLTGKVSEKYLKKHNITLEEYKK